MTKREQVPTQPRRRRGSATESAPSAGSEEPAEVERHSDTLAVIDELLDEIDTILEETAIQVDYRQKGGQ